MSQSMASLRSNLSNNKGGNRPSLTNWPSAMIVITIDPRLNTTVWIEQVSASGQSGLPDWADWPTSHTRPGLGTLSFGPPEQASASSGSRTFLGV